MAINVIGAGAVLYLNISGTYTALANISSIGGPEITVADIDVTNLGSAGIFKQFLAGFGDAGTVQMEANFDPATFNTLFTTNVRVVNTWRIIFSNGSKWDFTGYINAIKTENPLEEQVTMPFSIKVTGLPTFTQ